MLNICLVAWHHGVAREKSESVDRINLHLYVITIIIPIKIFFQPGWRCNKMFCFGRFEPMHKTCVSNFRRRKLIGTFS